MHAHRTLSLAALPAVTLPVALFAAHAQASVFAGTVEQTLPFSAVFQPGGGEVSLTFDAFDPQDVLEVVAVTLTIDATADISAALENVASDPVIDLPVRYAPGARTTFDLGSSSSTLALFAQGEALIDAPLSLPETDNQPGSGPDFISFDEDALLVQQTWDLTSTPSVPDILDRLTEGAAPTVGITPTTFFSFPEGFPDGTAFLRRVDDFTLTGDVTLSFTFIPSPGTLLCAGLGLIIASRRIRQG